MVGGGGWVGESQGGLLDLLVGGGEPSVVLTLVFVPGSDPELFEEPVTVRGVAVQLPAESSCLQP